jgi:hypothetical protein
MPINLNLNCTDCVLSQGFIPPCEPNSIGGNDNELYIISTCNIESFEEEYDAGIITDITLKAGAFWHVVKAQLDSVDVTASKNIANGVFTPIVTFKIAALSGLGATPEEKAANAQKFVNLASNPYEKYTIIVKANHGDGVSYAFGLNKLGLKIAEGTEYASGLTNQDTAQYTLVYSGTRLQVPVASTVVLPTAP